MFQAPDALPYLVFKTTQCGIIVAILQIGKLRLGDANSGV